MRCHKAIILVASWLILPSLAASRAFGLQGLPQERQQGRPPAAFPDIFGGLNAGINNIVKFFSRGLAPNQPQQRPPPQQAAVAASPPPAFRQPAVQPVNPPVQQASFSVPPSSSGPSSFSSPQPAPSFAPPPPASIISLTNPSGSLQQPGSSPSGSTISSFSISPAAANGQSSGAAPPSFASFQPATAPASAAVFSSFPQANSPPGSAQNNAFSTFDSSVASVPVASQITIGGGGGGGFSNSAPVVATFPQASGSGFSNSAPTFTPAGTTSSQELSVVPPPKTVTNFGVPEFFDPEAAAVNNEAPVSNDVDVFSSPNSSIIDLTGELNGGREEVRTSQQLTPDPANLAIREIRGI